MFAAFERFNFEISFGKRSKATFTKVFDGRSNKIKENKADQVSKKGSIFANEKVDAG